MERIRDVHLAYATEFMARQKLLGKSSVEKLLGTSERRQTPAQQKMVMQILSARYGIPLRRVPRAAS